ncbi:MAG: hypothetical protein AABZ15_06880 [Nitrospirota bacterium]
MNVKYLRAVCGAVVLLLVSSCLMLSESRKSDYGVMESAVTFASDKVIGEYGNRIPDDFDANKFLSVIKDRVPADYYHALETSRLHVTPMRSYYFLQVYDRSELILFDYSCTPAVDGPILLDPKKYDLDRLELYDACK